MSNSRTNNSIRNASITTITQVVTILLSFINRTIFIRYLGINYLSVNGLFANILSLLSFAELGIGSAITYSLYKPISQNNEDKIASILNLYRKAYKWIAISITALGLCCIPFLKFIIKDPPNIKYNLIILYILFLSNTVASYIMSFKKAIITADQKDYIVNIYQQFIYIIQSIIQMLILIVFANYILYLIIQIICTILTNLLINKKADKLYPFIKNSDRNDLSKEDKKNIFSNIKAIFLYKVGSVVLTGTDNIIISSILQFSFVGLISNYTLIINSINSIITRVFESIASSVGNLNASSEHDYTEKIFNQLFFVAFWVFSFSSICLILLLNPFIRFWLGNDFVCHKTISVALVSTFFVTGMNIVPSIYRTTLGYFEQVKYTPILAAIMNIILSLILGNKIGLSGVFFATTISRIFTYSIIDPVIVYKNSFNVSPIVFYKKYLVYTIIMICSYFITNFFVKMVSLKGFGGIAIQTIISVVSINIFFFICFFKTKVFNEVKYKIFRNLLYKNK